MHRAVRQTQDEYRWCRLFFFQAEDGIRDLTVTGVQTCALPICRSEAAHAGIPDRAPPSTSTVDPDSTERSEEHTSELQSQSNLVCRLLLEKKKNRYYKEST